MVDGNDEREILFILKKGEVFWAAGTIPPPTTWQRLLGVVFAGLALFVLNCCRQEPSKIGSLPWD
jgi:hypothetical protein